MSQAVELHGNHCGLGHEKHAHGTHAGLKIGQTCDKADHGGGSGDENTGDDDSGDEGGEA